MTTTNKLLPKVSAEHGKKIWSLWVHVSHPQRGCQPCQIILADGTQENIAAGNGVSIAESDHDEFGTALEIELRHELLRSKRTAKRVAVTELLRVGAPLRNFVVHVNDRKEKRW